MRLGPALAAVALAVAAALALATAAAAAEGVELIEDQGPPGFKELPFPPEEGPAEDPGEAVRAWTDKFLQEQAEQPPRRPEDLTPRDDVSLLERLIGVQGARHDSCGVDETQLPVKREYLVVLPAGDDFDASKWLNRPERANWDLVVIYYGARPERFSCPLCKAVYVAAGPKWRLAYRFTLLPEWAAYRREYGAVMWPDDDLVMDTCTVNRIFSVVRAYGLLMAQPSLCEAAWSHTPWKLLYNDPGAILRFTTFVEIMAPVFEMGMFDAFIRPTLHNAHVGWGLDFVWPFLLHYPRDRIGVIDEVCIYHPPSNPQKGNSVYEAEAPYDNREEEARRFAGQRGVLRAVGAVLYGYFESEIRRRGWHWQPVEVLGVVPRPRAHESLLETSNKILSTRLGPFYPLLLLGQALIIAFGCLVVACLRLRHCAQLGRPAYKPVAAAPAGV